MISQAAEYALRAIVCLAQHPGSALTTRHIAAETRVPEGYLAKVMQGLGRAQLVSSQRGVNGGFLLTGPAEDITLLRIVRAVDVSHRITTCPLGLAHHGDALCPLHRTLDEAAAKVEEMLRATTVAELISNPAGIQPLCGQIHANEVTT